MQQTVLYAKLLALVAIVIESDTHIYHNDAYTLVYHQEHKNHQSASDICKTHGGYLPVIRNHIIPEILIDVPILRNVSVWIGLNYVNGAWLWDDGSMSSTSSLTENLTLSENECMSVWLEPNAEPGPQICETKLPFFCQYNKGNCYFRNYRHSSIVGHNKFSLTSTSLNTCKTVCGHATEFECASFEYSSINKFCQLNDVNRWTAEENYVYFDHSWDYYHKACYISTILPEESDQTVYTPMFSDTLSTSTTATIHTTEAPNPELIQAKRYILQDVLLSWIDAVAYCESTGAQLATIEGPSNIPETGYQDIVDPEELFWIGLRRVKTKGWHWIESSALEWSNFKYEPNNLDFLRVCGTVSLPSGWWFTNVCEEKRRFICQYNTDSCQFIETNNAVMIALNSEIYHNISQYECQNYCVASSLCRSYEYNKKTKKCQLSTENRWTAPQYFQTGYGDWKYVHRRCSFGENSYTDSTTTMSRTSTISTMDTLSSTITMASMDYSSTRMDEITTAATTTVNPTVLTNLLFKEMIQELKQLGKAIKEKRLERSRTSAVDNRPSAKGAGIVAVIILVGLLGSIAVLDISTISLQCKQFSKQGQRKNSRNKYRTQTAYTNNNNNNAKDNIKENHGCLHQRKQDTTSTENVEISIVDTRSEGVPANTCLTIGLHDIDSKSSKTNYQDVRYTGKVIIESSDQETAMAAGRRTSIAKGSEQKTIHKDTEDYVTIRNIDKTHEPLSINSDIIVQNNSNNIHQNTNECMTHL